MTSESAGALQLENVVEVDRATVTTWDGESLEVHGGAWLSPEAVLRTTGELERLRRRAFEQDQVPKVIPALVLGAGLVGLAVGFWLGRRGDD